MGKYCNSSNYGRELLPPPSASTVMGVLPLNSVEEGFFLERENHLHKYLFAVVLNMRKYPLTFKNKSFGRAEIPSNSIDIPAYLLLIHTFTQLFMLIYMYLEIKLLAYQAFI